MQTINIDLQAIVFFFHQIQNIQIQIQKHIYSCSFVLTYYWIE